MLESSLKMFNITSLAKYFARKKTVETQKELFQNVDCRIDRDYNAKSFLNSMYEQGYFLECIEGIVNRENIVVNDQFCLFPDFDSDEPSSHFEGVNFRLFNDELIISEAACSALVDQACAKYVQLHPEDSAKINAILQSRLF